jgi:hypothetical protein
MYRVKNEQVLHSVKEGRKKEGISYVPQKEEG